MNFSSKIIVYLIVISIVTKKRNFSLILNKAILIDNYTSKNIPNIFKCLSICKKSNCKIIFYNQILTECNVKYANPSLIEYENLPEMNITYLLGILTPFKINYLKYF